MRRTGRGIFGASAAAGVLAATSGAAVLLVGAPLAHRLRRSEDDQPGDDRREEHEEDGGEGERVAKGAGQEHRRGGYPPAPSRRSLAHERDEAHGAGRPPGENPPRPRPADPPPTSGTKPRAPCWEPSKRSPRRRSTTSRSS